MEEIKARGGKQLRGVDFQIFSSSDFQVGSVAPEPDIRSRIFRFSDFEIFRSTFWPGDVFGAPKKSDFARKTFSGEEAGEIPTPK